MSHSDDETADSEQIRPVAGIHLSASASDHAQVNQAGRDQHFHYHDGVHDQRSTVPGTLVRECPYPGLAAFGPDLARWFFGREHLTAELIAHLDRRLSTGGIQVVVAPSGAGKSSLLRAGLAPKLGQAALPGSDQWPVLLFTPTSDPVRALAAQLAGLTGDDPTAFAERMASDPAGCVTFLTRALRDRGSGSQPGRVAVVVDQLEELFALCQNEHQRRTFLSVLDRIADAHGEPDATTPPTGLVVVGVRADFYAACADHPTLRAALQDAPLVVGPMSTAELRAAVLFPAQAVGLDLEPGLVELLLRDLGATPTTNDASPGYEAGRLPLLAHALRASWQQRHGSTLTVHGYQATGGIQHAIATSADHVYGQLDDTAQRVTRSLFLRLIKIGDATEDTRRRVPRSELMAACTDPSTATAIIDAFTRARLLILHQDTVEIAHEALLRSWPELRRWIDTDRAGRLTHQHIEEAATAWERSHRDPSGLYRGSRLDIANTWTLTASPSELSPTGHAFLDASTRARRRTARRRRVTIAGLTTILTVALVLGSLLIYAQQQSSEREALANSRTLAQSSQDTSASDPALSVMMALAAYHTSPTQEARNQLLRQYMAHSHSARVLSGLLGKIATVHTSRDGNVVLASTDLGSTMLFVHAATGTVRSELVSPAHVLYTMVAPDGKRAGFVDDVGNAGWFDVNPDAAQPAGPVHTLPKVTEVAAYYDGRDNAAAMSADGKLIAVPTLATNNSDQPDRLTWWNLDTGTIAGSVPAPPNATNGLWISPDNRTLLVQTADQDNANNPTGLIGVDMATGRFRTVVTSLPKQWLLVSGDHTAVVVCSPDGGQYALRRVRVTDGIEEGRPYSAEEKSCTPQAVDTTGRRVVLDDDGGSLAVVDLDHGTTISTGIQAGMILHHVPDLVSVEDRSLIVSRDDAQITYTELPLGPQTVDVADQMLTNDGSKTVNLLRDGSLQLWQSGADSDRPLAQAPAPNPPWDQSYNHLRLRSDGALVADREAANVVTVRDTTTLQQTARIIAAMPTSPPPTKLGDILTTGHKQPDNHFDYFFDWTGHLVTVSDTQVQQWDAQTGQQLAHFDAGAPLPGGEAVPGAPRLSIGPYPAANQVFLITDGDPVVRVVDLTTGHTTTTVQTVDDVVSMNFDSSGRYFALLRKGSIVELWRRDPLRKELGPLHSLTDITSTHWYAGFIDGNGRYMIAANNSIRVYLSGQQAPVDSYEFGHPDGSRAQYPYSFITAAKDGKTVIYADEDNIDRRLTLDPAAWERDLCGIIGNRSFTPAEQAGLPARISTQQVCPE